MDYSVKWWKNFSFRVITLERIKKNRRAGKCNGSYFQDLDTMLLVVVVSCIHKGVSVWCVFICVVRHMYTAFDCYFHFGNIMNVCSVQCCTGFAWIGVLFWRIDMRDKSRLYWLWYTHKRTNSTPKKKSNKNEITRIA